MTTIKTYENITCFHYTSTTVPYEKHCAYRANVGFPPDSAHFVALSNWGIIFSFFTCVITMWLSTIFLLFDRHRKGEGAERVADHVAVFVGGVPQEFSAHLVPESRIHDNSVFFEIPHHRTVAPPTPRAVTRPPADQNLIEIRDPIRRIVVEHLPHQSEKCDLLSAGSKKAARMLTHQDSRSAKFAHCGEYSGRSLGRPPTRIFNSKCFSALGDALEHRRRDLFPFFSSGWRSAGVKYIAADERRDKQGNDHRKHAAIVE